MLCACMRVCVCACMCACVRMCNNGLRQGCTAAPVLFHLYFLDAGAVLEEDITIMYLAWVFDTALGEG